MTSNRSGWSASHTSRCARCCAVLCCAVLHLPPSPFILPLCAFGNTLALPRSRLALILPQLCPICYTCTAIGFVSDTIHGRSTTRRSPTFSTPATRSYVSARRAPMRCMSKTCQNTSCAGESDSAKRRGGKPWLSQGGARVSLELSQDGARLSQSSVEPVLNQG